jgi:flagellar protein FliO/FliZ
MLNHRGSLNYIFLVLLVSMAWVSPSYGDEKSSDNAPVIATAEMVAATTSSDTGLAPKTLSPLAAKPYRPGSESSGQLTKVMLALGGVLALIMGLAWLFKQFVQPIAQRVQRIKVISSLALGSKEKLLRTEVNGQQILIGVTAGSICALKTFAAHEVTSTSEEMDVQENEPGIDFKTRINQLMKNSNH